MQGRGALSAWIRRTVAVVSLAIAAAAMTAGCATKVVDLGGEGGNRGDGGDAQLPGPFCIDFTDSASRPCYACYDQQGSETNRVCKDPALSCSVVDQPTGARCVSCVNAAGETTTPACLGCSQIPSPDRCAICRWSDRAIETCVECLGVRALPEPGPCDALRPELR